METAGSGRSRRTLSSTPDTGEGWLDLLRALTDEELGQYGQLAQDQIERETRWNWAQRAGLLLAAGCVAWAGARLWANGFDSGVGYLLGFAAIACYWPWRSGKTQRLWESHKKAVDDERLRRLGEDGNETRG